MPARGPTWLKFGGLSCQLFSTMLNTKYNITVDRFRLLLLTFEGDAVEKVLEIKFIIYSAITMSQMEKWPKLYLLILTIVLLGLVEQAESKCWVRMPTLSRDVNLLQAPKSFIQQIHVATFCDPLILLGTRNSILNKVD